MPENEPRHPPRFPTIHSLTSYLPTARLRQILHPHRWTPLYLSVLNIHIRHRTYTPPPLSPALHEQRNCLSSVLHPDPDVDEAQRIADSGYPRCILTLTSPPDGYQFLHELLFFIAEHLLGVDKSYGVEMVEHQERPKITGYRAPLMSRCMNKLCFQNTIVEFCATGYLRSTVSNAPMIVIVDLEGVRHRHAAVVAHILALGQQRLGCPSTTTTATTMATTTTTAEPRESTGRAAKPPPTPEEVEVLAIGITYRPKTTEECDCDGSPVSYDITPLYTLYQSSIPRSYLDGVAANTPTSLEVKTSETFDVRTPEKKVQFALDLLSLVSHLSGSGIAQVGSEEAQRIAEEVRVQRRDEDKARWKSEENEANVRVTIAVGVRRAKDARIEGRIRQQKLPVVKARKRKRVSRDEGKLLKRVLR